MPKFILMDAHGPFDVIGDVHGCADELEALLEKLGYRIEDHKPGPGLFKGPVYQHPEGRQAIFLGDLVDRGPRVLDTLQIGANMVRQGSALCVLGNHDDKLRRKLRGHKVQVKHGLEATLAEISALPHAEQGIWIHEALTFLEARPTHYVLDDGRLVVAHAGLKEPMHGRETPKTKAFALYGETTGKVDEYGLPVRGDWASQYQGDAFVVYGHTPVAAPERSGNTINVDTGCVMGGYLSAYRYPEDEVVSIAAKKTYYHSMKPFPPARSSAER